LYAVSLYDYCPCGDLTSPSAHATTPPPPACFFFTPPLLSGSHQTSGIHEHIIIIIGAIIMHYVCPDYPSPFVGRADGFPLSMGVGKRGMGVWELGGENTVGKVLLKVGKDKRTLRNFAL